MKIGLIGLNKTGKTTLFRLLTGKEDSGISGGKAAVNIGTCFVPDERIDFLSKLYNPKKTTYAKIDLVDVAGFSATAGTGGSAERFLSDARSCDALVHVLRVFESDNAAFDLENSDPSFDLEAVETEMLFADLEMIEKRIGRIRQGKKITGEHEAEIALLQRCFEKLENGEPMRSVELTETERIAIRGFSFLTEKPRLAVANLGENQLADSAWENSDSGAKLQALCGKLSIPLISLCVDIELEISRLPQSDRKDFMADIGIAKPGVEILAGAIYGLLGHISFLTVGEDEVRAWTIEKGTAARKAAGKIHSDIERGFIRAEVVKYADILELGAMSKVKEKGLFRLEGKEYTVADGDIINFRFNV